MASLLPPQAVSEEEETTTIPPISSHPLANDEHCQPTSGTLICVGDAAVGATGRDWVQGKVAIIGEILYKMQAVA